MSSSSPYKMSATELQEKIRLLERELQELRPLRQEVAKLSTQVTILKSTLEGRDHQIESLQKALLDQASASQISEGKYRNSHEAISSNSQNVESSIGVSIGRAGGFAGVPRERNTTELSHAGKEGQLNTPQTSGPKTTPRVSTHRGSHKLNEKVDPIVIDDEEDVKPNISASEVYPSPRISRSSSRQKPEPSREQSSGLAEGKASVYHIHQPNEGRAAVGKIDKKEIEEPESVGKSEALERMDVDTEQKPDGMTTGPSRSAESTRQPLHTPVRAAGQQVMTNASRDKRPSTITERTESIQGSQVSNRPQNTNNGPHTARPSSDIAANVNRTPAEPAPSRDSQLSRRQSTSSPLPSDAQKTNPSQETTVTTTQHSQPEAEQEQSDDDDSESLEYVTPPPDEPSSRIENLLAVQPRPGHSRTMKRVLSPSSSELSSEQDSRKRKARPLDLSRASQLQKTNGGYPTDIVYNRLRHLADYPIDVPSEIVESTFTRAVLSRACGGGQMDTVPRVNAKMAAEHGYKRFMCLSLDYNPHAPQVPGKPGLFFVLRDKRLWPKEELVITKHKPNKWNVMGFYRCRKEEPLTAEEFKSLSDTVRKTWRKNTANPKCAWGLYTKAAILLRRSLGREPTEAEIDEHVKRNSSRTYEEAGITDEVVEKAFMQGEERMNVFSMECIRYDVDFKQRIINGQQVGTGQGPTNDQPEEEDQNDELEGDDEHSAGAALEGAIEGPSSATTIRNNNTISHPSPHTRDSISTLETNRQKSLRKLKSSTTKTHSINHTTPISTPTPDSATFAFKKPRTRTQARKLIGATSHTAIVLSSDPSSSSEDDDSDIVVPAYSGIKPTERARPSVKRARASTTSEDDTVPASEEDVDGEDGEDSDYDPGSDYRRQARSSRGGRDIPEKRARRD